MASDEEHDVDGAKLWDRLGFALSCNGLDLVWQNSISIGTVGGGSDGRIVDERAVITREYSRSWGAGADDEINGSPRAIHLLPLGISILRYRNRGGTAAWYTGILCKVPPIRANAVARIEHVLGRELRLTGGLSPGLSLSLLFLVKIRVFVHTGPIVFCHGMIRSAFWMRKWTSRQSRHHQSRSASTSCRAESQRRLLSALPLLAVGTFPPPCSF